MDDSLKPYHCLTLRSRLQGIGNTLRFYARSGVYTMQLLFFTYQNLRVLQHFHWRNQNQNHEQLPNPCRLQLRHLKTTLRQCLRLFSPRYLFMSARNTAAAQGQRFPYESLYRELDALQWAHFHWDPKVATPLSQYMGAEYSGVPSLVSAPLYDNQDQQQKRDPLLLRTQVRVRWWRRLSLALSWRWQEFLRRRALRAQLYGLQQQMQDVILREQQRIATSTQTALALTLANSIDLRTSKELATLCQSGGKKRRRKKLTKADIARFDQALSQLDNNFATLRRTLGQGR